MAYLFLIGIIIYTLLQHIDTKNKLKEKEEKEKAEARAFHSAWERVEKADKQRLKDLKDKADKQKRWKSEMDKKSRDPESRLFDDRIDNRDF